MLFHILEWVVIESNNPVATWKCQSTAQSANVLHKDWLAGPYRRFPIITHFKITLVTMYKALNQTINKVHLSHSVYLQLCGKSETHKFWARAIIPKKRYSSINSHSNCRQPSNSEEECCLSSLTSSCFLERSKLDSHQHGRFRVLRIPLIRLIVFWSLQCYRWKHRERPCPWVLWTLKMHRFPIEYIISVLES